ncbi:Putative AC transposase [Linum grandiflorum]
MFSVPSRNTMKREIFGVYESERNKIQKTIDENRGRIAITTDMWTASNQKKGYMAVTAHYIDNSWTLRSHMLRFIYVPAPHSSDRLAAVLVNCMLDWNIDTKVSTITLDNCSTNDAMIAKIKKKLVLPYLLREGAFLHMRCSAHILNLIVKDGFDIVKEGIETIRESVSYWLATAKRLEFFQETCKQLRVPCEKRLVLDCPTRWNSTFLMLAIAIPYKDWLFASIVCEKLHCFSLVSDLFSGSKYPTANLFFPRICDLRIKISEWMFDPNEIIQRMVASMDILPRTSDFDLLMWWKINGPKYPILQEIARDILAVPITSVASESAFSSGGRLLDPHRSRLHESTVEALMCTRTWLQDNGNRSCNVTSLFLY